MKFDNGELTVNNFFCSPICFVRDSVASFLALYARNDVLRRSRDAAKYRFAGEAACNQ